MNINEWIIFGETGISSKTMWAAIAGVVNEENRGKGRFDIPCDVSDFRRCYKFWKQCSITQHQMNIIKDVFPFWEPFIDNWDRLVSLYEKKDHENLYKLINEMDHESRINRGWTKTRPL